MERGKGIYIHNFYLYYNGIYNVDVKSRKNHGLHDVQNPVNHDITTSLG